MSKVGLITFYENNYGSILQCYATKTFLQNQGYDCIVISCKDVQSPSLRSKVEKYLMAGIKSIFFKSYFCDFIAMRKAARSGDTLTIETRKKMNDFVVDTIKPKSFTLRDLRRIAKTKEFDKFIVGSDQVWNVSLDVNDFYFLTFAPTSKKIAFSVSIGVSKLSDYEKYRLSKRIKSFKEISVREKTGKYILEDVGATNVTQLSDPTILLSKKDWESFENSAECYKVKSKYVLIHFLNEPSDEVREYIRFIKESTSFKLIMIGYKYQNLNKEFEISFHDADPKEYVAWINHAEIVLTDSFHTTLFSINLNTQFFVFKRAHIHKSSQESRLTDLLGKLSMMDRYIEDGDKTKSFNNLKYEDVSTVNERDRTKKWLLERLN